MLDQLKANNRAWAERMASADADFFKRLDPAAGENDSRPLPRQ